MTTRDFTMNAAVYVFGLLAVTSSGDGYVFLQVRKGENQSNVDALIHKVVPNSRAPEDTRKRLDLPKRYELLARPKAEKGLESVVLAIDAGADPNKLEEFVKPTVMQKLQDIVVDFFKDDKVNAFFRSKKDTYNFKPEIVHFKSGKPSLMLELNFKSIMRAVKDLLKSKKLKQYTDTLAQKAAMVYRALKESEKEKRKESDEESN